MKRQHTLSDLFRNNAHKLNEAPPLHSWQRLEARLDQHRQRSRRQSIRQYAMAAVIGGIVLLAAMLSLLADRYYSTRYAMIQYEIESLDHSEIDEDAIEAVALSRQFDVKKPAAIAEGQAGQRLVPRGEGETGRGGEGARGRG